MADTSAGTSLTLEQRELYRSRRARTYAALGDRAALILAAAPELTVGRDTELRYQVDPELFYLTGYAEPEAVAVLVPGHQTAPFTMFVRPRDQERERWTGQRGGPLAAVSEFGADEAFSVVELRERLPALLAEVDVLYARADHGRPIDGDLLQHTLASGRRSRARTGSGVGTLVDPGLLLDEMRVVKDEHERALMRRAAEISVAAFLDAITHIAPGRGEWEVEAALDSGFRTRGGDGPAFPTIVAGGTNATVLHYTENAARLSAGGLVLLDAGARYRQYCADISRTLPVSGRFATAQRELYDLVLAAHDAAIAAAHPGATVDDLQVAAQDVLLQGLIDHRLLPGPNVETARADEAAYKRFLPHKVSHWLGLDVHDVGAYAFRSGPRSLEPGMMLTVEPGLYIPPDCMEAPAELRGTGIRIEDDLLITSKGHEVLTAALPVSAAEIEALLQERRT